MSKDKALDIVLSEFLELAKVPRPSHHEERVSEYLFQWAKTHGLAVEKDNMNEIMEKKMAIIAEAEALKTSTEWKKATDRFISLQNQWKEIGAVPRK